MSPEASRSGDDLCAGNASFTPRFALLNLPPLDIDPEGKDALHEMAHADTFAGTDFYALFAQRVLKGETVPIRPLAPFLEVIPTIFGKVGGRHSPGTLPNPQVVEHLEVCVQRYRKFFGKFWRLADLDPNQVTVIEGQSSPVSGSELFNRSLLLSIFHVALELALVRADTEERPENFVAKLHDDLVRGTGILIPQPGQTIKEHVGVLMGCKKTDMADMFADHIRLADVLLNAEDTNLLKHITLLPALIGVEFFVQWWPPVFTILFFAHQTDSYKPRVMKYVQRRLRSEELKSEVAEHLMRLHMSLRPRADGCPVLVDPEFENDYHAQNLYELMAFRSFMASFPGFLRWLMTEPPFPGLASHCAGRIDWLEQHAADAVDAYMKEVARILGHEELAQYENTFKLSPSHNRRLEEVRYLRPR